MADMTVINHQLAETLIKYLIYLGFLVSIMLIVYPLATSFFNKRLFYTIFKKHLQANRISRELMRLISTTLNTSNPYALIVFYMITFLLFLFAVIILLNAGTSILNTAVISVIIAGFPYLILIVKLYGIRLEGSYEANELVTELLDQYKINYNNITEAIDSTIPLLTRQPYSRKALSRLSFELKSYKTRKELEEITYKFNYAIDTQWSQNIANCIFMAIEYGEDITQSLEDILEDLKSLKKIQEQNRQLNQEGYTIAKWVTPGLYAISLYLMFTMFGFTFKKFIDYQLAHPLGLQFFIASMMAITISYLTYYLTSKPKNDF